MSPDDAQKNDAQKHPDGPVATPRPSLSELLGFGPGPMRWYAEKRPSAKDKAREKARERRREQALNHKLLVQLVIERLNAPDGRFASGLRRIVRRNMNSHFARLGLR
jgi:hypothetical protein